MVIPPHAVGFIIGLRKDHFLADEWEWPTPIFDDKRYPVARDIAVPDEEVHPNYWRKPQGSNIVFKTPRALEPGKVQPIGFTGDPEKPGEMGTSKNPNFTHSWDGGLSTQLSTNGGSKRPSLKWTLGDPIDRTRMIVPTETLRAASLDEASYLAIAKKHFCRKILGTGKTFLISKRTRAERANKL